jgi:AbrB family looped-hinge helix DNA binding protein
MSSLVGTRGRITIDKEIRQRLGLKPGWRVFQRIEGNTVVLEFSAPRHQRSSSGLLSGKTYRTFQTDDDLYAAIEDSWELIAQEVEGMPADGIRSGVAAVE